jgi:hypothetical protein
MPKQMMIFAGIYQNNGTGRDTFISLYRKGTGKTGEPGAYQGCCGEYGGGITRYSGFTPAADPGEVIDTKPYSCHKELLRLSTAPASTTGSGRPLRRFHRFPCTLPPLSLAVRADPSLLAFAARRSGWTAPGG